MEFPDISKEELEETLNLIAEARSDPSPSTWLALADRLFNETLDISTVEEEEEEADERAKEVAEKDTEEEVEEDISLEDILHGLVEVAWEAWTSDPDRCWSWVRAGLLGDNKKGLPPFLNMRAGSAHLDLALFLERAGDITLTQNGQALGRVLLLFHMSEAFIRPGMATAAFLLRVWMKKEGDFEDLLLRKLPGRDYQMASYGMTRDRFTNEITAAKKMFEDRICIDVLDKFMSNEDAEITLSEVRNAVGHHNLDILNGMILIGWVEGYPEWNTDNMKSIPPDQLKEVLWGLRGLVVTLLTWERMMVIVFNPDEDPNFDASKYADGVYSALTFLKRIFEPYF